MKHLADKILFRFFMLFIFSFGLLFSVPIQSIAQSEEDILNSVGNELEDESARQKEAARIEKEYKSLKTKAEAAYKSRKFEKAKEYYNQMIKLKPDSDFAQGRLAMIDQKIAEAKAIEDQKRYDALISQADVLLANEKWKEAETKYLSAANLQPNESYPKDQIKKIAQLQANAKAEAQAATLQKKYDTYIHKADAALASQQWEDARKYYTLANKTKPNEDYPTIQLSKIEQLKKEAEEEAQKEKDEKRYKLLIDAGNNALTQRKWDEARKKYQFALEIKPQDKYAKEQLAQVDIREKRFMEKEKQVKIDAEFKKKIQLADQLFNSKKWSEAISAYKEALAIKPLEEYPKNQVVKANSRITEELEAKKRAEQLESDFQKQKKIGEDALANKNWLVAIEAFKAAKTLKPQNTGITNLLSQAKAGKKADDELALKQKAEKEAKEKLQKQFDSQMSRGVQAMNNLDWKTARLAFNKARLLKPEEKIVDQKLAELNKKMAEEEAAKEAEELASTQAAQKAKMEKLEAQKAAEAQKAKIRTEFESYLNNYKLAISKNNWDDASLAISAAKNLLPDNKNISFMETELAKLKDAYAKKLAKKQVKEQQEAKLTEQYQNFISKGDIALGQKNFQKAKENYKAAQKLKPNESYPSIKLDELKALELSENQAKLEQQKALDKKYSQLMAQGESAMNNKNWQQARKLFINAQNIKPNATGPKERLTVLQQLQEKEKKLALAAAELEEDYNNRMKNGQDALNNDEFANAKRFFSGALALKPNESLPREKIEETNKRWAEFIEQKKQKAAEKLEKEKDERYTMTIMSADKSFEQELWNEAIAGYQNALTIKPDENYPKERLKESKQRKQVALELAEKKRKEEEARLRAEEEERLRKEAEAKAAAELEKRFTDAVLNGDLAMSKKNYRKAINYYQKASKLKPDNAKIANKWKESVEKYKIAEAARIAAEKERKRLAAIKLKKRQEAARKAREAYLSKIRENSSEQLAKRYPDGLTEEREVVKNTQITKSIIVEKGQGRYLLKFEYTWGERFYYLNGKRITEDAYNWNIRKYKF